MKSKNNSLLTLLVTLATPMVLIGLAVRILLTPLYYTVEYNMPYFPVDEYGFTTEDRLKWAPFAVNYLINNADQSYLGNLKFGDGTPLFNERELTHMADVKILIRQVLFAWYASIMLLVLLGLFAWQRGSFMEVLIGLRRGGWLMIFLATSLGTVAGFGILLNPDIFWQFFTLFHQLFFTGDSWLFYFSDTLIRLFPIRFWQDAVLTIAILTIGGGVGLAFGIRGTSYSRNG